MEEHAIRYMMDNCVNNNIRIRGYRTQGVQPKIIDYGMSVVHGKIVAHLSFTPVEGVAFPKASL